jgi:glutaredoxin-like protein NrdH
MAHQVKLYALTTCGHCRNTKALLADLGVTYDVVDVDKTQGEERTAMIEEVKKYNPACTFPTLIIDDKVIVGFRKDEIEEALKE